MESVAWKKVLDCRYGFGGCQSVEDIEYVKSLRGCEESEKQAGWRMKV